MRAKLQWPNVKCVKDSGEGKMTLTMGLMFYYCMHKTLQILNRFINQDALT